MRGVCSGAKLQSSLVDSCRENYENNIGVNTVAEIQRVVADGFRELLGLCRFKENETGQ